MNLSRALLMAAVAIWLTAGAVAQTPSCSITSTDMEGEMDNFAPPADAAVLSPGLTEFLAPHAPAGCDVDQPNHHVGLSFRLRSCETCGGRLEIRVRRTTPRDIGSNDTYTVGVAPFTPALRVTAGTIWQDGNLNPKTVVIPLDRARLNQVLCTSRSPWLDVFVEDDTVVDWMRLTMQHP